MLLNYLKLSLRLLARNPFLTLINVVSLSVGFAVFFVLWQYSHDELRSDQFHHDFQQIYKVGTYAQWTDNNANWQGSMCGANHYGVNDLVAKHTDVLDKTYFFVQRYFSERFTPGHDRNIFMAYTDELDKRKAFLETKIIYAEPNFFRFFSLPLLQGNKKDVLNFPDAVAISEQTAIKYFGSNNPIGKTLYLNNTIPLQVTGVFKDLPNNTHLDFNIVISTERIRNIIGRFKGGELFFSFSYCKLPVGTDIDALQNKIKQTSSEETAQLIWGPSSTNKADLFFQPLKEVAFQPMRFDEHQAKSKYILYAFASASILILLMAWINYVNLAISSGSKRLKELAARKTVGARASDFVRQFMVEVGTLNILSFLLAITLVQLFKRPAASLLQFHISEWTETPFSTWIILISALLAGILLTGFYLTVISLKRSPKTLFRLHGAKSKNNTNAVLAVVQFAGTFVLVIWVFTVHNQLSFLFDKDIGIDRENVLVLDVPRDTTKESGNYIDQIRTRAAGLPAISNHTLSSSLSADYWEGFITLRKPGVRAAVESNGGVDESFVPFYGIKILAGRNFQHDMPSDRKSILISRGAMLRLGIDTPEHAIGQKLVEPEGAEIIGVFEDYNLRPLFISDETTYGGIPGIALTYKDFLLPDLKPRKVSLKVSSINFSETIRELKAIYESIFPGYVFNWYFLGDQLNAKYESDKTARNQILFFSSLAIGIACLGLLGIVSNKVLDKTKEIGIRKVMGARLRHLAQVLLGATVKHLAIATVTGVPIAYLLCQQYLQKFSERIALQWWHFTIPILILLMIMFSTIASVLWKTAQSNPVDALRTE